MAVPELTTNPMSLGKVAVTSGTPVSILANLPTYAGVTANKIRLQAAPGNTSAVMLGTSATMNTTTYAGVIAIIAKGDSWELEHNVGMDKIDVDTLYIDGATTGDFVVGFIFQG